ncbi:MAG: hypothetical protein JSU98_04685 [Gemmatimonadales bacterium]|nr:MAG: hypothetical protein JSU98_04685 [Gemmatimonadales bacterium]
MSDDTAFDWGTHTVPDDREASLALGPLELRFTRSAGEIHLTHWRQGEGQEPRRGRWVPGPGWDGRIALTPAHPDRPVIVKPEDEFWLLKGAEARIYVRIPLVVRVEALGAARSTVVSLSTKVLSDTWWGSREDGELCYFLDTKARRSMEEQGFLEHLCVCPLQLKNLSPDDLLVTRIALRPKHLSVFRDGNRLWSELTSVRYRGEEVGSELDVASEPPEEATAPERLSAAEIPMARGFTARTFARLRSSLGEWL